ncbi:hypothetical protein B0H10DRAFT_2197024 [Mycena sp. CBHHK59/15]|nr:hypothetical protein B0H10DRAFT_2197024 [Mycena sp. CBHHK59/15]
MACFRVEAPIHPDELWFFHGEHEHTTLHVSRQLCVGRPNPGATANYARAGFTQQDVAALEQPVPVADTLSIDMSSDSEPGDSSLSFSLSSDLSSSLDSADSCHDWSHLLASDWRLGESSSDSSTSSTGSSSDEDDNMPELHPAGYHDSDDDSSAGGSSSASDSGSDGDDEEESAELGDIEDIDLGEEGPHDFPGHH